MGILLGLIVGGTLALNHAIKSDAKRVEEEAEDMVYEAEKRYNEVKENIEREYKMTEASLAKLGAMKVDILRGTIRKFLNIYERLPKNIKLKEAHVDDLKDFITQNEILELKEMSDTYMDISFFSKDNMFGVGVGAVIGAGVWKGAGLALEALGIGGTVLGTAAAGLSSSPLAALAAPVLIFSSASRAVKADENLEKAKTIKAEVDAAVSEADVKILLYQKVREKSDMFLDRLIKLDKILCMYVEFFDRVTKNKCEELNVEVISADQLSKEEISLWCTTLAIVKAVKAIIDKHIINDNGDDVCEDKETDSEYNGKINEWKKQINTSNTALALMQTSSESGKSLEPEGDKNQAGQELGRPLVGRIYNGSLLEYVKKTVEQNNH